MRTTLYSRLKPNYKEIVEKKAKNFPATGKIIVEALQKTIYSRLTIGEVTDLTVFVGLYNRTEVDWYSGEDLFDADEDFEEIRKIISKNLK